MTRAKKTLSTILALGMVGMTAACTGTGASSWNSTYSNKRNDVQLVRLTHNVQFVSDSTALDEAEQAKLDSFMADINAGYGDEAWVDAGDDTLAIRRSATVMTALRQHGVVASGDNLSYGPALKPGEVRVVIGRYMVTAPECPDWRKPSDKDFYNTTSSNYGCSTASNLGMMVANPRDLIEGRSYGGADTDRAMDAVDNYRSDSVETLKAEGTGG